eukprot:2652274-Rhodomonas_salina.1
MNFQKLNAVSGLWRGVETAKGCCFGISGPSVGRTIAATFDTILTSLPLALPLALARHGFGPGWRPEPVLKAVLFSITISIKSWLSSWVVVGIPSGTAFSYHNTGNSGINFAPPFIGSCVVRYPGIVLWRGPRELGNSEFSAPPDLN